MKRAFITGITGQDGSYLAELLLSKGYEVHALVRRSSTYTIGNLNEVHSDFSGDASRVHLYYGDLSDFSSLARIIREVQPDEVYNLGAMSDVRVSFDIPEYTADITALGALRVLEAVRMSGKKDTRIYQASTSEIYGKVQEIPQRETTPFYPRSPYAVSKLFGHWICKNYREAYGMFICSGILFNHESPRRGTNFVTRKITRGLARIVAGKQDKLYLGNLDAKRDWGYAPEYVEAMWRMMQHPTPDDYVIATGETHTVREFLDEAFGYVGLDWHDYVETKEELFRPTEADILIGDATKAQTELGWKPKVGFKELVRILVDHDLRAERSESPSVPFTSVLQPAPLAHTQVTACRLCDGSTLRLVLDLGYHPPSDAFVSKEALDAKQESFPLRLVSCADCGHLQIDYHVDPKVLYQDEYPYEQSTTETGRAHYRAMAQSIVSRFQVPSASLAIDIGSNVGVLLEGFKEQGLNVLGVDPATNMAEKALARGIPTLAEFFSSSIADRIVRDYGQARVITGTNVFAHIHNVGDAMQGIQRLLASDGVLVFESPSARELVEQIEYDTIYHEHLGYMSVKPVQQFCKRYGLELFDVEPTSIHGGSLRYFIGQKGAHPVSPRVEEEIQKEEACGLYNMVALAEFAARVQDHKLTLTELLMKLKKENKRIVAVSAPAKGNTLLNYCGIDTTLLEYVTEKAKTKIGKFTPGTFVPVVDDQQLLKDQPDYALILAWNFAPEIMRNLQAFHDKGGRFIIPIPEPRIV